MKNKKQERNKLVDLGVTMGVAPFSRLFGYPIEMGVIHLTTQQSGFLERATSLYPKARFPAVTHVMSGVGPAVRNGIISKPGFAVWPLFLDRENNSDYETRVTVGFFSGVTQAALTYQNKLFTLMCQAGVGNTDIRFLYQPSFFMKVLPSYVGLMCFSNLLVIESFYIAKGHVKSLRPNASDIEHTVSATALGLLPASALLTLPERAVNLKLQRELTVVSPAVTQASSAMKLGFMQFCLAICLRTLWKGVENGIMIGGSLYAKNRIYDVSNECKQEESNGDAKSGYFRFP